MTPQERNQLIDEVIEGLKKMRELGRRLSICVIIGVVLESNGGCHLWDQEDFAAIQAVIFR